MAKTYANHLGYCRSRMANFTLACDCDDILDYFDYSGGSSPSLECCCNIATWGKMEWEILNEIPNAKIIGLDTQEIMPNVAFDTMNRVTKELGIFKETEKIRFADRINRGDLYGVLPFTLYANTQDIGKVTYKGNYDLSSLKLDESIKIFITTYQIHNNIFCCDYP